MSLLKLSSMLSMPLSRTQWQRILNCSRRVLDACALFSVYEGADGVQKGREVILALVVNAG